MIEVGEQAPDFTLPDQDGEDVSLSALAGQTVVLCFYPETDTLGVKCSIRASDRNRPRQPARRRHGPLPGGAGPRDAQEGAERRIRARPR
jgi:hypothetical protein